MSDHLRTAIRAACAIVVLLTAGRAVAADVDVLIGFDHAPNKADHQRLNQLGGKVRRSYRNFPILAARVPDSSLIGLAAHKGVTHLEPDGKVQLHYDELAATWGVERIGAGDAHTNGQTGAGVKVAVIDTGIDYTHPDLDGRYAGGYDFVNDDDDPLDDNGHGTHVSGTIAAVANGFGVVGVAPDVQIYALKVLAADGSGSFSSVIAAVDWCITNGIQVTNNSYGSSGYPGTLVETAFIQAAQAGIVHVGSAGNSGKADGTGDNVGYPGGFDSVIAVAATDQSDVRASFSSTGPQVELAAPGVSIPSTLPGDAYGYYSGTSMASPHVAGTAALLVGAGVTDGNGDGLINDEVRTLLQASALDLGDTGRDQLYGYGRVDAAMALTLLSGTSTPTGGTSTSPAPAPVPIGMTVAKMHFKLANSNHRDLVLVVKVVDENGDPVSNASVTAKFTRTRDGVQRHCWRNGVTNLRGKARLKIRRAPRGLWSADITELTADGYLWDGNYPQTSYRLQ